MISLGKREKFSLSVLLVINGMTDLRIRVDCLLYQVKCLLLAVAIVIKLLLPLHNAKQVSTINE